MRIKEKFSKILKDKIYYNGLKKQKRDLFYKRQKITPKYEKNPHEKFRNCYANSQINFIEKRIEYIGQKRLKTVAFY